MMSALANQGNVALMLDNTARMGANSRTIRISSAYPLGACHPRPRIDTRQNSFPFEKKNTPDGDGRFPCFSVGPCYLVTRPTKPLSSKSSTDRRSILLPVQESIVVEKSEVINEKKQRLVSKLEFQDLNISACDSSKYAKPNVNVLVTKVSLQKKASHKETNIFKTTKTSARKVKKAARKKYSKRSQSAKSKFKKDATNFSTYKDKRTINSTNKVPKMKSYDILIASDSVQPKLSKSLPSLSARPSLSPNKMQNLSLSIKSGASSAEFESFRIAQKAANRTTKVYLSDKQSRNLMGIPAVPPCTPFLDTTCEVEWIPSMSDIKSQRLVSVKLSTLFTKQTKKENEEKFAKEQKRLQEEKMKNKELMSKLKQRQRAEIYALNKILAEVEKSNYEKFKEERGLPV